MDLRHTLLQPRVITAVSLTVAAGAVGLVVGYSFGVQVGGTRWLGLVAALCGGGFCSLMADSVITRLLPPR